MSDKPLLEYTRAEIAQHNSVSDYWTVIRRKVYCFDEEFISNEHPGGYVMLSGAGKDGTHLFFEDHWHSEGAQQILEQYCIGILKPGEPEGNAEDEDAEEKS